jgi:hypothetical protein
MNVRRAMALQILNAIAVVIRLPNIKNSVLPIALKANLNLIIRGNFIARIAV